MTLGRSRLRGRSWGVRYVLPLIGIWLVAALIAAGTIYVAPIVQARDVDQSGPTFVRVGLREDAERTSVNVKVTPRAPEEVHGSVDGVVTAVKVAVGQAISTGTPMVTVSGVTVIGYVADAPLYRPLAMGDTGPDVVQLSGILHQIGYLTEAAAGSSTYGAPQVAAVKLLQRAAGAPVDGTFTLSLVAWVPTTSTTVSEIRAGVGSSVADGAALVTTSAEEDAVAVTTADDQAVTPMFSAGALEFSAGSHHSTVKSLDMTGDEVTALAAELRAAANANEISSQAQGNGTVFNGVIVSLADPRRVGVVPSSALFVARSGGFCVFEQKGNTVRAAKVQDPGSVDGELGSTAVSADLSGQEIARYPNALTSSERSKCM